MGQNEKRINNVRLLKANEIGLTDDVRPFEDGIRTKEKTGSYEWWYFDSKFEDGSSLVIDFFTKPVTSFAKSFRPYVTLDFINPNGTVIHTKVESNDYSFSKEKCDTRIGNCYIKGDLENYEICFENEDAKCHLTLCRSVPSWRPDSGHIYFGNKDFFAWLPAVPEGAVDGVLETKDAKIVLNGTGYHDHNWGNKLMLFLMNDWYWGRAKIGDYVVVSSYIYANKKYDYRTVPIFMLAKDGVTLTGDAQKYLTYEEKDFEKDTYTERFVAHTLIYDYNDEKCSVHYRVTYKKGNEEVERQTMRDIVGKSLAALFYILGFRGSYHRMSGTAMLEKLEGDSVIERIEAPAMWEQMCFKPDRIKSK